MNQIRTKYEKKILRALGRYPDQVFKTRALSKQLKVPGTEYRLFRQLLKRLAEENRITRHKGNQYGRYQKPVLAVGKLQVKAQGYGFLVRDDGGEDIFISQKNMGSALHGDRVEVRVWAHQAGKLPEGQVQSILERGRESLVGLFMESYTYNYVIPDDLKITRDIYLSPEQSGRARPGQKVVTEILDWGDAGRMPEGRVVEVLGYPDDPGVDVLSVARGYGLNETLPEQAEKEAASSEFVLDDPELARRMDLREWFVFTVDPEDAKDFDDAVSLTRLENGNFQLGVHIADVSHFVPAGSEVDKEAFERGTSVYLVDRVIPMLPERLSNNLCSLKPGEDRFSYSVLIELTPEGERVDFTISESLIRSRHRLTYEQVQGIIDGKPDNPDSAAAEDSQLGGLAGPGDESRKLLTETLKTMHDLSLKLLSRWRHDGSIDFDAPEPLVVLDEKGIPVSLGVRPRHDSHRLIEAFMLLANRTVAEFIDELRRSSGLKLPFLYRVHQKPTPEKLLKFSDFVRAFGYTFDPGKKITPKKFQRFLDSVQDKRHKAVIDDVAIRTMMKASYTTANTGHFGLAFKAYTHFTSPIRRYPDLMVHRLLKSYQQSPPKRLQTLMTLAQIADQATAREISAQEAERESIRAKQVDFMAGHLGMEFDGVISGVTAFGFFVEITEFMVEGLVAVRDLSDDYYLFDEKRWLMRGERTGRTFRLGDAVRVQVVRVHREMRKIDFMLAGEEPDRRSARHIKRAGKRKRN